MNAQESAGEPSCKRQENGDASTGSDRPLKKARFAWQVKGKYHLKNDSTDAKSTITPRDDPSIPGPSTQSSSSSNDLIMGSAEQNLEILGDYLLKQDFNTLDSVITDTDKSLIRPCSSISSEKLEYPKYVPSVERAPSILGTSESAGVPMSLVTSNRYNEEQCIARWQARQMAKGFVDNTINRVLDSWMSARLPTGMEDNGFLALDVAEFINNLPGDNSIENEGILMAISAHGLQNNSSSSEDSPQRNSPSKDEGCPSRSSSPILEESQNNRDKLDSETSSSQDCQMAWLCDGTDNNPNAFSYYPDTSNPSYLNYPTDDPLRDPSIEFENADNDFSSHFDFMDTAVSFAIQNKGLTSFGTDYG